MLTRIIELPSFSDHRGDLTVVEHIGDIPFEVKRAFWTYNVPDGKSRGAHAHRQLRQLLVAISGSFTVNVDDGKEQKGFLLDRPSHGLLVEPGEWSSEDYFSPGAVCLVLCSDKYEESDYIRNHDVFRLTLEPDALDSLIGRFYDRGTPLHSLLMRHSKDVTALALEIVDRHPELKADRELVRLGAMLHDIGICQCDAPGIHCNGTEPYVIHGYLGGQMLRQLGYDSLARFCERHTGAGITKEQIVQRSLPLPVADYQPETIEEQIVCYADKFFSKSRPDTKKTFEQACRSLEKFGVEGVKRFTEWHKLFT